MSLVSIIIPAYNSEKFIAATIQTALNQTWDNKEIIIVDDGSSDNTLQIAKEFEILHESIKVYSQDNKGACSARNRGFSLSKGNYIQFLDADDLMEEQKIEKQMMKLQQEADSIIGCRWIKFINTLDNNIGGTGPYETIRKDMTAVEWLLERRMMVCHAWLTSRNLIEASGGWDEALSCNQDGEFFCRVVGVANKVLYQDDTIVYYRIPPDRNGVSVMNSPEKYISLYKAAVSYKNVLNALTDHSNEAKTAIGNYFKRLEFDNFYPSFPDLVKLCKEQEEYFFANTTSELTGMTKAVAGFIGWKLAKRLSLWYRKVFTSVKPV
jgi:glycosyltransferase involved in cell wall biosynthesis